MEHRIKKVNVHCIQSNIFDSAIIVKEYSGGRWLSVEDAASYNKALRPYHLYLTSYEIENAQSGDFVLLSGGPKRIIRIIGHVIYYLDSCGNQQTMDVTDYGTGYRGMIIASTDPITKDKAGYSDRPSVPDIPIWFVNEFIERNGITEAEVVVLNDDQPNVISDAIVIMELIKEAKVYTEAKVKEFNQILYHRYAISRNAIVCAVLDDLREDYKRIFDLV